MWSTGQYVLQEARSFFKLQSHWTAIAWLVVSTHLKLYSQNGFIFPKYGYSKNKNCFKPPPSCHFSGKKELVSFRSITSNHLFMDANWIKFVEGRSPPATVGFVYLFFQLQVNNFPTVGFANGPKINMSREKGSFFKREISASSPINFQPKKSDNSLVFNRKLPSRSFQSEIQPSCDPPSRLQYLHQHKQWMPRPPWLLRLTKPQERSGQILLHWS